MTRQKFLEYGATAFWGVLLFAAIASILMGVYALGDLVF